MFIYFGMLFSILITSTHTKIQIKYYNNLFDFTNKIIIIILAYIAFHDKFSRIFDGLVKTIDQHLWAL